jgi:hypothetical protein
MDEKIYKIKQFSFYLHETKGYPSKMHDVKSYECETFKEKIKISTDIYIRVQK